MKNSIESALDRAVALLRQRVRERTPVRSGFLRESVFGHVVQNYGMVATEAAYGAYVEFGTRYMTARSMFRRGLDDSLEEIADLLADAASEEIKGPEGSQ